MRVHKKIQEIPGETPKKRGRPPGSTNKPKPVIIRTKGELIKFTVVQQWDSKVVISIPGIDTPCRIPEKNFVAAALRWGFNPKGTEWPMKVVENGLVAIDWDYYTK